VKISSHEAFLILHKWQVELTPVLLVGSLMPSHPLRGLIAVVTREGVWNSGDEPASIWGFNLTGEGTSFLASKFEDFQYLQQTTLGHQNVLARDGTGTRRARADENNETGKHTANRGRRSGAGPRETVLGRR